jgi:hypothetical protein
LEIHSIFLFQERRASPEWPGLSFSWTLVILSEGGFPRVSPARDTGVEGSFVLVLIWLLGLLLHLLDLRAGGTAYFPSEVQAL